MLRHIVQLHPHDLDRVIHRYVLQQRAGNSMRRPVKAAVAAAMTGHVGRHRITDGHGGGAPHLMRRFILKVEALASTIADGVVRPGCELVLSAIAGPSIAAALGRDLEAEARIGDDVDPRCRRCLPRRQDDNVLPAIISKAPDAVEKFDRRHVRYIVRRWGKCRRGKDARHRRRLGAIELVAKASAVAYEHNARRRGQHRTGLC